MTIGAVTSTVLSPPPDCLTRITITGSATSSGGTPPCTTLGARLNCQGQWHTGTVNSSGVLTGDIVAGTLSGTSSGAWSITFEVPCCCQKQFTINVFCNGCDASLQTAIDCNSANCCPTVSVTPSYGACNAEGHAPVTFTVNVTPGPPAACDPAVVQLVVGSLSGASHTFSAAGSYQETVTLSSGPHTAYLNILSPAGCPQLAIPLTVPCPPDGCCPDVKVDLTYGECDSGGKSLVTFNVTVIPNTTTGCPPAKVQLDFGDGSPLGPEYAFSSAGSFQATHSYPQGSTVAFVNIIAPSGCAQKAVTVSVQCPPCCPIVTLTPCIPDCDEEAERKVEFTVSVIKRPAPCPDKEVKVVLDFGDGSPGETVTLPVGVTDTSFVRSHKYTGSTALQDNTAFVEILAPEDCKGRTAEVEIKACCNKSLAENCNLVLWSASFSLMAALVAIFFWMVKASNVACTTCAPFSLQTNALLFIGLAWLLIATILVILYLIFCTACRCGWLLLLLWRALFGAALIIMALASCAYGWLGLLIGAAVMAIALALLDSWRQRCCVSICDYLEEVAKNWAYMVVIVAMFLTMAPGCEANFIIWPSLAVTIGPSNGIDPSLNPQPYVVPVWGLLGILAAFWLYGLITQCNQSKE